MYNIVKTYLILITVLLISIKTSAQNWEMFAEGTNNVWEVKAAFYDSIADYLYVGGYFRKIDSLHGESISRWNGNIWDSVGGGVDLEVTAITKYNNQIYIGGDFHYANHMFPWTGGTKVNGIARWNGSAWEALGSGDSVGISGVVLDFYQYNGDLYVLGNFDSAGGMPTKGIAKWDGQHWSIPFPPINTYDNYPFIGSAAFYKNEFYVGGNFSSNQGFTDIQRWNGQGWATVGNGFNGGLYSVFDMLVYKGYLYVAGSFLKDGGVNPGNCIARWDGTKWEDIGGVWNNGAGVDWWNISKLMIYHDKLYVIGYFTSASDIPASGIASFDGTKWCAVSDIFDRSPYIIGVYRDSLFVSGGRITVINGDTLNGFALFTGNADFDTCGENMITGIPELNSKNEFLIFPNPSTGYFTLHLPLTKAVATLKVYDLSGQVLWQREYANQGSSTVSLDLSGTPPGLYLIEWQTEDQSYFGKLMIE